ncbi:MAG TPA: hypothetical protein VI603_14750 [Saprospiraceae bacterium]|nr:hypothetical protein [Saprospiraceae bacterium]
MANESEDNKTGKGKLGKPKDLSKVPRSPLPGILDQDALDAKQDRLRIRRKKGPEIEDTEERGLFEEEVPGEEEPPTDCED